MEQELEDCQNTISSKLQEVINTYRRTNTKSLPEASLKKTDELDTFVLPENKKGLGAGAPSKMN